MINKSGLVIKFYLGKSSKKINPRYRIYSVNLCLQMEWLEKLATCTCKCCISVWCQYYVHFVVSIENSRAYYITIYAAGALHCILLFGSKRAIYNTLKKIRKLNRTSLCRVSVCVTCQFVSRVFFVSRVCLFHESVCVSCLFVSRVSLFHVSFCFTCLFCVTCRF